MLCIWAAACGAFLGDDIELRRREVHALRDAGRPQPPPDEDPVATCELGETRCDGTFLETCVRTGERLTSGWVPRDCGPGTCTSGPPADCAAKVCEIGEVDCLGITPRTCNADQTAWIASPVCESAAHCSTRAEDCLDGPPCCLEAPCETGDVRCNGSVMERCLIDRTGWETFDTCETSELCQAGRERCGGRGAACSCQRPTCDPGDRQCIDARLEMCNGSLTGWDPLSECATVALCERSLENASASCVTPACEPGEFFCTDAGVLQVCRDDRTGFRNLQACAGPPFCNVAAGRCDDSACEPGDMRCNGAQIQVCRDDQTGFESDRAPCATAALCDDSDPDDPFCREPVCDPGEFRCLAIGQPQRCNAGRTAFQNEGPSCPRSDLCSERRQGCDNCVPGRQECTPDRRGRRTCNPDGNGFGPTTDCPLGCAPTTGQCQQ